MNTKERISEVIETRTNPRTRGDRSGGREEVAGGRDDFVRRNPYLALGIALAAGCAIATLIRNRD